MGGAVKAVEKVATGIGKVVENVLNNPLPVIETIAITAALGPEGLALGLSPATSTAVASAAVSAANGGDINKIATAAAAGYAGGAANEAVIGDAKIPTETTKIAASAAGASASTVTAALASGQPLDKALEAGLASGALAAGTTGVMEAGKAALAPPETGQGIKVVPGASSQLLKDTALGDPGITEPSLLGDQTKVSGLGLTDKVPTGGGQGLTVDPANVLFSSQYAPSTGKVRGTEEGGLQPAYTSESSKYIPPSFDSSLTGDVGYKEPQTVTEKVGPPLTPAEEAVAKKFVSTGLSDLFGLGPKVPGAPSAGSTGAIAQGATTGTTTGLAGERGAGEIESKETGKERQNVWNEESLRLKDALGV